MNKAGNNVFSGWRFIFKVQTYRGKIYSLVSVCSTSEPDLILRMCLSVHKEFHFIKLILFRNCVDFLSMSGTMPCSSLGHQPLLLPLFCSFSLRQVRDWLKQLLIDNSQPLGVDREELVCICCVIYLSGTFPTVGLLALIFRLRKKRRHLFEWET